MSETVSEATSPSVCSEEHRMETWKKSADSRGWKWAILKATLWVSQTSGTQPWDVQLTCVPRESWFEGLKKNQQQVGESHHRCVGRRDAPPAPIVPLRLFFLFVCLNTALSTDPTLRLFLSIKFYWHTAIPVLSCIVHGYLCITTTEQSKCKETQACKTQNSYPLPLCRKLVDPWTRILAYVLLACWTWLHTSSISKEFTAYI